MIDPHVYLKDYMKFDKMPHDGGDLYDHLSKVEKILRACNCEEDVCLAGLFHSVYGNSLLDFQRLRNPNDERKKIQEVIGERAEFLVWVFCNAKRPFCWFFGKNIPMQDGSFIRLDEKTIHDLYMIESANLIQQQGGLREIISFASKQELTSAPMRLIDGDRRG